MSSEHRMLFGTWAWESATYKTNQIITVEFDVNVRTNHQGIRLMLGLFGRGLELNLYDREHWSGRKRRQSRRK